MDEKYKDLPFIREYTGKYLAKDDILELYKKLSYDGKVSLENFKVLNNSLYKKKYMFKEPNGDRLATKLEVAKAVFGVYYEKESILDLYKTKYISIILDYITTGKTYERSIDKNKLISVFEYMMSEEFIGDLTKIKNAPEFGFYDKEVDIGNCELTIDVLKTLKKELDPDYGSDYSKIAFKIAKNCLKNKDYLLSKSQLSTVEIEYNKIKRNKELAFDVLDKARKVKANIDRNSSYCNMIYDIACQALNKGSLSEKQEKLLVDYFDKELSHIEFKDEPKEKPEEIKVKDKGKPVNSNKPIEKVDSIEKFDDLPEFGACDFDWK